MALIKCPECGKEVSDQAVTCPNCGYPIAEKKIHQEIFDRIPECVEEYRATWAQFSDKLDSGNTSTGAAIRRQRLKENGKDLYMMYYILKSKGIDVTKPSILDFEDAREWIARNKEYIAEISADEIFPFLELGLLAKIKDEEKVNRRMHGRAEVTRDRWKSKIEDVVNVSIMPEVTVNVEAPITSKEPKRGCPHCGALDIEKISLTRRVVSTQLFGLASDTIGKSFKCNKCGYSW